jgi:hypothetical protein
MNDLLADERKKGNLRGRSYKEKVLSPAFGAKNLEMLSK